MEWYNWIFMCKKMNPDAGLIPLIKMNSMWITDLNVNCK